MIRNDPGSSRVVPDGSTSSRPQRRAHSLSAWSLGRARRVPVFGCVGPPRRHEVLVLMFVPADRRYHEALQTVTPADAFHGRQVAILARRARIKQRTLQQRKRENLHVPPHAAIRLEVSL